MCYICNITLTLAVSFVVVDTVGYLYIYICICTHVLHCNITLTVSFVLIDSYASDCNMAVCVKGMNFGIRDFTVSTLLHGIYVFSDSGTLCVPVC